MASYLSPSDMWQRCRDKKTEIVKEANVPKVYGVNIPPEWELQRMYKQLKMYNTNFTTWLVESVYPTIESLPSHITLSRKQAKREPKSDLPSSDDEPSLSEPNRLPKIRPPCEPFHRACWPNAKCPIGYRYPPGSPH